MMIYLLETSICLALFYGLYHLIFMKSSNHNSNRMYLIGSIALALCIPLISVPFFAQEVILSNTGSLQIGVARVIEEPKILLNWSMVITMIYGTGVIISALVFLRGLLKIQKLVRSGEQDLIHGQKVIFTDQNVQLCSFGGYIIAPRHKKGSLSEYELTHERTHLSKRHSLDILFVNIIRTIFWFNPVLALYEKRLIEIHEYQADHHTLGQLGKESYLDYLVKQVADRKQPALVHNFNSLIKKRLIMMSSESKTSKWQYIYALPLLLISMIFFSFESYPVYLDNDRNEITMDLDTFPIGTILDTVQMYNFETGKRVARIIVKPIGKNAYILPSTDPAAVGMTGVDTLSTIDYDTYVEEIVTYNYRTGAIDTIK